MSKTRSPILVLVADPGKPVGERKVAPTLANFQRIVGGAIQQLFLSPKPKIAIYCNDNGLILKLPENRLAPPWMAERYSMARPSIVGPFCVFRYQHHREESLTGADITEWRAYFDGPGRP